MTSNLSFRLVFVNFQAGVFDELQSYINNLNCDFIFRKSVYLKDVATNTKEGMNDIGTGIMPNYLIRLFNGLVDSEDNVIRIFICKDIISSPQRFYYDEEVNSLLVSLCHLELESEDVVSIISTVVISSIYSEIKEKNLYEHSGDCCFNLKTHERGITNSICDICNRSIGKNISHIQRIMNSCCDRNRSSIRELANSKAWWEKLLWLKSQKMIAIYGAIYGGFLTYQFIPVFKWVMIGATISFLGIKWFDPKFVFIRFASLLAIGSGAATKVGFQIVIALVNKVVDLDMDISPPDWKVPVAGFILAALSLSFHYLLTKKE